MPIKKFFLFLLLSFSLSGSDQPFTIMIDPSGDAKHTGRLIQNTLERGVSLQCAEALKKALLNEYKNLRIVFTRVPGETIKPLQNASFANRLDIDLYLSLYFYYEPQTPSHLYIYHYIAQPTTDSWHKPLNLYFYQADQAHLINLATTKQYASTLVTNLKKTPANYAFKISNVHAIPFKPLLGIQAPAIALEIGIKQTNDWKKLIAPLTDALESIIA